MKILKTIKHQLKKNVDEKNTEINKNQRVPLTKNLNENAKQIEQVFSYPTNKDFIRREVYISSLHLNAIAYYVSGLCDPKEIEEIVLRPLLQKEVKLDPQVNIIEGIERFITTKSIEIVKEKKACIDKLNNGMTALFVEGQNQALMFETTMFQHRQISVPQNEVVLRGPNEGFVESLSINKSLIRKQLKDEKLVTENINIGNRVADTFAMMYISNLANMEVVNKVKERVKSIKTDNTLNLSMLEQLLEERPYSLVPSILNTERPDRAASYLLEGHVVLLADNSPDCLVVPVTFWSFFHSPEDTSLRWAYGNFIRLIRLVALFLAVTVPAFYIAATNYHIEMIPTDLALAIAAKRELVPFPALIEVLIMDVAFEILREAGIRVPSPMGPTIGIVGALILGQAAVAANIISPIMVIVVSITGLASFAIPDISFTYMVRISRFIFLACAAVAGLLGIAICLTVVISYLVSLDSFGIPFLSPMAPSTKSSRDLIFRRTIAKDILRPTNIRPQDNVRKKPPEKE